jgi:hypothetical protein
MIQNIMTIMRRATQRNHGWATVAELSKAEVEWDSEAACIVLSKRHVRAVGTSPTKHHYKVTLSLEEIAEMLTAVRDGMLRQEEA